MRTLLTCCLLSGLLLSGCSDSGNPPPLPSSTTYYSEQQYHAGVVSSMSDSHTIVVNLEPSGNSAGTGDTGGIGYDEFNWILKAATTVDLCMLASNRSFLLELLDAKNVLLSSMTSQALTHNCAADTVQPVTVPAGSYKVRITHDGMKDASETLLVTVNYSSKAGALAVKSADTTDSATVTVTQPPKYDPSVNYSKTGTLVQYSDNQLYTNAWYASAGHCPVQADCSSVFEAGLWSVYDPTKPVTSDKHEFTYYDYAAIKASYPAVKTCTASDYSQASVISTIEQSIASGDLKLAKPKDGYTQQDKEALYREYMLPCMPDLTATTPANVATVMKVMPKATWDTLASRTYTGDGSLTYTDANGKIVPWPAENGFSANTYSNFLSAVARYPFFCGEKGYFSSVEEACKREIASLFAHAAQETGETQITKSYTWLREYGWVNGASYYNTGCADPFDCTSNSFARYYGRGPTQLTYYYNYAGFSAAYFNGDYNFLLKWPDMVAYDGKLYFASVIWFVMAHQSPKPSIHDVMLGRYQPADCKTSSDCNGLQYDPLSGVQNNFNVTIEVVNGGPECRGKNAQASANRSNGFTQMLDLLKAVKVGSELNPVTGCDFIANTNPDPNTSIFAAPANLPKAGSQLQVLLDMSDNTCLAQSTNGTAMISVTATGIVTACNKRFTK